MVNFDSFCWNDFLSVSSFFVYFMQFYASLIDTLFASMWWHLMNVWRAKTSWIIAFAHFYKISFLFLSILRVVLSFFSFRIKCKKNQEKHLYLFKLFLLGNAKWTPQTISLIKTSKKSYFIWMWLMRPAFSFIRILT